MPLRLDCGTGIDTTMGLFAWLRLRAWIVHALFLLLAAGIGLGSAWVPHYLAWLFPGELRVLGPISDHGEPCLEPSSNSGEYCRASYRIPREVRASARPGDVLGIGVILYRTDVSCEGSGTRESLLSPYDVSGQGTNSPNVYQVLSAEVSSCPGDIIVRAYASPEFRRSGHVDAPMVLGIPERVREVKVLVEFFRAGLLSLLMAIFLAFYVFDRTLARVADSRVADSPVESMALPFIGYVFLLSGFINTVFPMGLGPFGGNRAVHFLAWLAFPGTLLHGLGRRSDDLLARVCRRIVAPMGRLHVSPLALVAFAGVLVPGYNYRLAPMIVAVGALALVGAIVRRDHVLVWFGLASISDGLKSYAVLAAPLYCTTPLYALLVMSAGVGARMRAGALVVATLKWAQRTVEAYHNGGKLTELLASLRAELEIPIVLIEESRKDGQICDRVCALREGEVTLREAEHGGPTLLELVPRAAHRTMHAPLTPEWLAALSPKGVVVDGDSRATLLCLEHEGATLGVLALLGYAPQRFDDDTEDLRLRTALDVIVPFLARALAQERMSQALSKFLPEGVGERLLGGHSVREVETGYLLMVDIRGSTKLARRFGNEVWELFMTALSKDLAALAKPEGLTLQLVVWDAFYFTMAGERDAALVERIVRFASVMHAALGVAIDGAFSAGTEADGYRARFCLAYGDTTRDVRSMHRADWTIVGKAMAAVCKLEQACKDQDGWFFSTTLSLPDNAPAPWHATDGSVPATGEVISVWREAPVALPFELHRLVATVSWMEGAGATSLEPLSRRFLGSSGAT